MKAHKKWTLLSCIGLASLCSGRAQVDTNVFDAGKVLHFWSAMQGSNAVRLCPFGDSMVDPSEGGKLAGFAPPLGGVVGGISGGVNSVYPYLCYATNGIGVYAGPDTNWWWFHHYLTNGSVVTFMCIVPNGPSGNTSYVWSDTVAAYYITSPGAGSFTISISTNGGPFGVIRSINTAGLRMGAATNLSLPLNYYQMKISCTNGSVTLIDGGMWNEHQRNLALEMLDAPGLAYNDWTSIPTNITWPIFKAMRPDLVLMEAKDSSDLFRASFPLLEQMFTNCAPNMDAIYIGTTAQGTNGDPNVNAEWAIPQNAVMADFARQFRRAYWDSFGIISYEQATALGWTSGDGVHFNYTGATAYGNMLWSDFWSSLHQLSVKATAGQLTLSWYALTGRVYQVQYTPTLFPANWQNLGAPVTATNFSMNRADLIPAQGNRFYRLVTIP